MQSKRGSLVEVVSGTAVAFLISLFLQHCVVDPVWHLNTSFVQNLSITALFTVVSVARSYVWRRLFNWLTNKNKKEPHVTSRNHG